MKLKETIMPKCIGNMILVHIFVQFYQKIHGFILIYKLNIYHP